MDDTTFPQSRTASSSYGTFEGSSSSSHLSDTSATVGMADQKQDSQSLVQNERRLPTKANTNVTVGVVSGGEEARHATDREHDMTFIEALKMYPTAVGWSVFFSIGIIMVAFDPQVLGNLYATPAFQRDFGYEYQPGKYVVSAAWQSGLSMGNPIGQVVGALFAAYPMEWIGRKKTFAICNALTAAIIFIQFFARRIEVLFVGELLGGLVWGNYATIAPTYASEVCPTALRGTLTSYINLCFVIGQLIANGITAGTSQLSSHWAYSAPFAIQWLWPAVVFIGISFAPESPWYLVRKGRIEEASQSLKRLASSEVDTKPTLAMIIETDRLEQEMEAGSHYRDCFRKINIRRTEIAVGVYTIQVLSGIYLVGYATYFFEQAGLPTDKAFDMGVGFLAVGFCGTLLSWLLLLHYGRRLIYNTGLAILIALLFVIGIIDCVPGYTSKPGLAWTQASLMLVWNFCYDFSVGPVNFVIITECSATKLRSKTIAVATAVQAVMGIVMTVAIPYMINPDEANMRGKIGFLYGGISALCLLWAYFRVPETKGRTYEELDIMFARDVPTRQFKNYKIE